MNGQGHFALYAAWFRRIGARSRCCSSCSPWSVAARPVGIASRAAHWLAAPSSRHSRRHRRNRRRGGRRRRRLHLLQHQRRGERDPHPDRQRAMGGGLRKDVAPIREVPQPRVVDVALNVDIYPNEQRVNTTGRYTLENRTASPSGRSTCGGCATPPWSSSSCRRAAAHGVRRFGYRIYALETRSTPARVEMRFSTFRRRAGSGMRATRPTSSATAPSTTCWSRRSSGWDATAAAGSRQAPKYGLPAELRLPKLEDEGARANHYLRRDSDWVTADITVSTDDDQLAIAPGYQVSAHIANGRRVVRYRTDAPIMHFFSIQSAAYG